MGPIVPVFARVQRHQKTKTMRSRKIEHSSPWRSWEAAFDPPKTSNTNFGTKLSCQEILGARGHRGGPWRRIFGGEVRNGKGEMLRSHLQPGRLRPQSGPGFIAIESSVINPLPKATHPPLVSTILLSGAQHTGRGSKSTW